ncbi:hypothetical protein Q5741_14725 [Paenibacillus sp. JX-17]|uniref:Nudix hydrolase domain-containing protein n=1 Tax=Paenibacillus lacisoli TaxID=3064525 RepID=A0ABT9CI95_9BACL|nr:hypothetical protein [Paenibacillus sp. JX-17]MDO7907662.1 hypothetical protein [Paenibacillus sp. JX-17]
MRIVVTGRAVIRDSYGRVLLQRRANYGDWGFQEESWSRENRSKRL